jgi:hypothetical protein
MLAQRRATPICGKASSGRRKQPQVLLADMPIVFTAIQSLYMEQLRPFGRIIRKRVGEFATGARGTPDVDAKHLLRICQECPLIQVEQEEGGDWSALIVNQPSNFIDCYNPEDAYNPALWLHLSAYMQCLPEQETFPGGRYACAIELRARRLPFLTSYTLGQLCHIVQLAISQKRILGYLNGLLVPYNRSQTVLKEHAAEKGEAHVPPSTVERLPLVSLDQAKACLLQLLSDVGHSPATMPLSNVKRLFRSRFGLELSETSLGHAKLCDLLSSDSFKDICYVRLDWNGYTVVQSEPIDQPRRVKFCADDPLALDELDDATERVPDLVKSRQDTPGGVLRVCAGKVPAYVQNTFIHAPPAPPTPVRDARPRANTMPGDLGSVDPWDEDSTACDTASSAGSASADEN